MKKLPAWLSASSTSLYFSVALIIMMTLCCGYTCEAADETDDGSNSTTNTSLIMSPSAAKKLLQEPRFAAPRDWKWSYFKNADAASIRYGFCRTDRINRNGTVVFVPGFTEFAEVYFETARDFLAHGYDVYMLDWRGAGGSDRYLPEREKAVTNGFNHDECDLDQFLSAIVKKQATQPVYLVAHSLGAHIALRYLHDHQDVVIKAVLSAPPLDCPGTQAPPWVVSFYSWLMCRNHRGNNYLDKQGDWQYMAPRVSKMATHSHDPLRVRLEEAWCVLNPALRSGGATWQWLWKFQQSCDLVNSRKYAEEITTPVLMGCALSDHIASPQEEEQLISRISNGQVYKGKDARHELFLEADLYRTPWMNAIYKFLTPTAAVVSAKK